MDNNWRLQQFPLLDVKEASIDIFRELRNEFPLLGCNEAMILYTGDDVYGLLYQLTLEYLRNDRSLERYFIDCGTFRGGSALAVGLALKHKSMKNLCITIDSYTVDQPTKLAADNYKVARDIFHDLDLVEYVCPVIYDDINFLKMWQKPIQMAFVDSLHTYDHTIELLEIVLDYLVKDGRIVIHDYCEWSDGWPVIPAVNEFMDKHDHLKPYKVNDGTVCLHYE